MNTKGKRNIKTNLYLIGFMGTGKTLIGQKTAAKIGLSFVDSDQEIENQSNCSISEIFTKMGEEKFRELEKKFIQDGHPQTGCLVSCGGGLPIPNGMIETLKARGLVFCLWAEIDTIIKRISGNNSRPLLRTENPKEKIKALLKERENIYKKADQIISTEQKTPNQISEIIVRKYHITEKQDQK